MYKCLLSFIWLVGVCYCIYGNTQVFYFVFTGTINIESVYYINDQ